MEVLEPGLVAAHAHSVAVRTARLALGKVLVAAWAAHVAGWRSAHLTAHSVRRGTAGTGRHVAHKVSCVKLIVNISIAGLGTGTVGRAATRSG